MTRLLAALAVTSLAATASQAEPFTIVALGDMPYGEPAEVYPPFERLIETVNDRAPALVLHVGDTKSGSTPCSDRMLDDQRAYLDDFAAPLLYTPGDNEWTDCHREEAGGFDPLGRLDHIRHTYFDEPGMSFGAEPMAVTSQAGDGYPENVRAMLGGVMVVTAHVVGSNNNFEPRGLAAVEEFMARDAASTAWMREGFARAGGAAGLVLAIHADMFEAFSGFDGQGWARHSGFKGFGEALVEEAAAFGKPVLLVYGDSHVFHQARPFPAEAPNLMAMEVPGADDMHAVAIGVNTQAPGIFSVALIENPALSN